MAGIFLIFSSTNHIVLRPLFVAETPNPFQFITPLSRCFQHFPLDPNFSDNMEGEEIIDIVYKNINTSLG